MRLNFLLSAFACSAISVWGATPYITKVYDYHPAPGQFVNMLPEYEAGDTQAAMNQKCEEYICNTPNGAPVSLGAFGGYIIFGFDHPVINSKGDYDFKIYGNTFTNNTSSGAGSSEPGIVMVSYDANANGLPDDEWYELKGSEHDNANTFRGMNITYSRPDNGRAPGADPDPDDSGVCDRKYIHWKSNDPTRPEGYIQRVTFHTQSYWPTWINDECLTFTGTRLPDNVSRLEGGQYSFGFFEWGYADNLPNDKNPGFRISDAITAEGQSADLEKIHFIKVYTGINQSCGSLGEGSTEITGAEDLHPEMTDGVGTVSVIPDIIVDMSPQNIYITTNSEKLDVAVTDMAGHCLLQTAISGGTTEITTSHLPQGVYILTAGNRVWKYIR